MIRRLVSWLAWAILGLCAANVVVSSLLFARTQQLESSLPLLLSFLAFPLVGALIVSQRPANTVGWLFLVAGIGTAFTSFSFAYVQLALGAHADAQLTTGYIDLIGDLVWPIDLALGVLLLLLFPDGRPLSPRWAIAVWALLLDLVFVVAGQAVVPGSLEPNNQVPNPLGIPYLAGFSAVAMNEGQSLIFLFILLAITSLILRYRRAPTAQRQQIKWFVYGSAVMLIVVIGGQVGLGFIFSNPNDPVASAVSNYCFALGILALPVGVGMGVLRYRLYDIDRLINRTLVYGALTVILATLYFGLIIGAQTLIRLLTGLPQQSQIVIVLSTLLIAALVQPLRSGLQRAIDRRFYRSKYDAARTLATFGATLRQEVELDELRVHLLDVVEETMQPARVSLWLRPAERRRDGL